MNLSDALVPRTYTDGMNMKMKLSNLKSKWRYKVPLNLLVSISTTYLEKLLICKYLLILVLEFYLPLVNYFVF